ncbi:MAG: hypothetical protein LBP87_13460 [Planctomycetaceae bacterium]|nr:hypothetical protein [Planctomycetaceae bacterium]
MIYRGKFELAPFDPSLLNIDLLHNPPGPSNGGCCGGGGNGGGNIVVGPDISTIPEHYYFVDDVARDDYFEDHESELKKDVLVVSGGHLQIYDGEQWVYWAWFVRGENATITIGEVTTGDPGTDASVTNSGTETNAVLDFRIPRGDLGAPGSVETVTLEKVAAEAINGHRLVACDSDGKIITADWEHPEVLGLITQSVAAGGTVPVIVFGIVKHEGWSFDLVHPILLANDGKPVQSLISSYPVITRVGRPITTDSFLVTIELPLKQQ